MELAPTTPSQACSRSRASRASSLAGGTARMARRTSRQACDRPSSCRCIVSCTSQSPPWRSASRCAPAGSRPASRRRDTDRQRHRARAWRWRWRRSPAAGRWRSGIWLERHRFGQPADVGVGGGQWQRAVACHALRQLAHQLPGDVAVRVGVDNVGAEQRPLRQLVAELRQRRRLVRLQQATRRPGLQPHRAHGEGAHLALQGRADDRAARGDADVLDHVRAPLDANDLVALQHRLPSIAAAHRAAVRRHVFDKQVDRVRQPGRDAPGAEAVVTHAQGRRADQRRTRRRPLGRAHVRQVPVRRQGGDRGAGRWPAAGGPSRYARRSRPRRWSRHRRR